MSAEHWASLFTASPLSLKSSSASDPWKKFFSPVLASRILAFVKGWGGDAKRGRAAWSRAGLGASDSTAWVPKEHVAEQLCSSLPRACGSSSPMALASSSG